MTNPKIRTIVFYKDYFIEFFNNQQPKVRDKIIWTFKLIEYIWIIPSEYLKHMEGTEGLYEIRIQFKKEHFRIFCFFDDGKIIVLANGFQKKSRKTPGSEIEKALIIKSEYEKTFNKENTSPKTK